MDDGLAVGALRGGGETEKVPRADVLQQAIVGRGRGVVEFVDDDDVVEGRVELLETVFVEGLDTGEDVPPLRGFAPGDELFAEAVVFEDDAEHGQALVEDLAAVGDKEELQRAVLVAEAAVVEGRNDGLAGAGGGDHEVAGVAAATFGLEPIENLLLEGIRADIDVEGEGIGAGPLLALKSLIDTLRIGCRIVGFELAFFPVLLERGLKLARGPGAFRRGKDGRSTRGRR